MPGDLLGAHAWALNSRRVGVPAGLKEQVMDDDGNQADETEATPMQFKSVIAKVAKCRNLAKLHAKDRFPFSTAAVSELDNFSPFPPDRTHAYVLTDYLMHAEYAQEPR